MKPFHHMQPFDPAGNVVASSVTRTMKGQSLDSWDMFTRESLQNSWDARDQTSHEDGVTFAVDYRDMDELQIDTLRNDVFGNNVEGLDRLNQVLADRSVNALMVSDSGTNGLRGPTIASTVLEDPTSPQDFVSFIRNIGRSETKALKGGTYGFGKGVFFITSRVDTILVYTRTVDENNRPVNRFIAMANSSDFVSEGTSYTGRHWWGLKEHGKSGNNSTEYAEPFTGERADELARKLGMDEYFSETRTTGTCIAVLQPTFDDVDNGLQKIADSLTRWAWPHMLRFETDMDPIDFHVRKNGSSVPIPPPESDPAVKGFVRAYRTALEAPADHQNRWKMDFLTRSTRVWAARPKKELGRLGVTNIPSLVPEDITVLESDIEREIALLRTPRMVVEYWRGPRNPTGTPYCGVFIADTAADPVFARSEPAAHHQWNEVSIKNEHKLLEQFWGQPSANNPVKILKQKMKDLLKESGSRKPQSGEDLHFQSLTQLSSTLGSVVTNSLGGTDARIPKIKQARSSNSGGRARSAQAQFRLDSMFLEDGQIHSVFEVGATVPPAQLSATAKVDAYLAADRGRIDRDQAQDLGIDFPEVLGWALTEDAPTSTGDITTAGPNLLIEQSEIKVFALVRQPADAAVGLQITFDTSAEDK